MKPLEALLKNNSKMSDVYLKSSKDIYQYLGISFSEFNFDRGAQTLTFPFFADEKFQAHPGIVHGGITATLCDTGMGVLGMIIASEKSNVVYTADMTVHYKAPMKVNNTYKIKARVVSELGDKLNLAISISDAEKVIAEAEALFIQKPFVV